MKTVLTAIVLLAAPLGCCAAPASENKHAQPTVETIPFNQMKKWLHFTRADLDEIVVERGQLDFSSRFAYEGHYSLRWKYQPGSTLTWNCNYDQLGRVPTFYFTAFEPQLRSHLPSTFQIQFLDAKRNVACQCDMPLVRPFWNRCIIRLTANVDGNGGRCEVGIKNLVGVIPDKVTAVRIIPLTRNSGELFLGGWILTKEWMLRRDDTAEVNGFPPPSPPDPASLPEPSPKEIFAAKAIEEQLEDGFMADWFNAIGKPYETIVTEVMSHYRELNLRRTPEGMAGKNMLMEEIRRRTWCSCPVPPKYQLEEYKATDFLKNTLHGYGDFGNGAHAYCTLMLDLANCYRRENDVSRKAALLGMYEMMFDYSQYLSGFPGTWFGGEGYVESVFLLRKELIASVRLDNKLLELLCRQVKFDRIFLDRSVYNTVHPGDLGEDCDFTRITSERLIHLSLMEPNPKIKIHYLHAFQRWFSRIVLAYSPGVADTFKPDGSINHHFGLQFGYGNGALMTGSRVIHLLAQTPFAIEPNGHALFKNVLLLRRCFSRNGLDPLTLSGKEGLGYANNLLDVPYLLMAMAGTPDGRQAIDRDMAAVYLRLVSEKKETPHALHAAAMKLFEQANIAPEAVPQGHWTLGWSAAAIHRRDDWLLSIRGYSRYAYSRESGHPGNDLHVNPHLGFGTMELLTPSDYKPHYSSFLHETGLGTAGFDWTRFPGTTDVFLPLERIAWRGDWQHRSDQSFVGGVDAPNGAGVFVLSLHGPKKIGLDSLYARKSWFFFGDTILCLGTGIRNTVSDHETGTTLFQDFWRQPDAKGKSTTPLYWNAATSLNQFPLEKQEQLTSPQWLINRQGIGFYLYSGQQLNIRRFEQHSPASDGKKETSGKFTTTWLSHGKAPQNASYRYVMRVGTTPEAMAAFSESMSRNAPYEIHQQNDTADIVASKPDSTAGYVIFKADATLSGNEVASVSKPCVITTHRAGADMVLSVADPDLNFIDKDRDSHQWGYSQPSSITVTLHGRWGTDNSAAAIACPKPGDTGITIQCKDGVTSSIKLRPVSH
jgi:chondroitin-sulfate-ABC endolyase/exolyase